VDRARHGVDPHVRELREAKHAQRWPAALGAAQRAALVLRELLPSAAGWDGWDEIMNADKKPQPKPSAQAIRIAKKRIDDARTIGWAALEESWQATLDQMLAWRESP
jgi:hypothetical protein